MVLDIMTSCNYPLMQYLREDAMGKLNKHKSDRERFGKCDICMELIPVEYYFDEGDEITCRECGTDYILVTKVPVKLSMLSDTYDPDDYSGEMMFED